MKLKLYKTLVSRFKTQKDCGKVLGCNQSMVSDLVRGVREMTPLEAILTQHHFNGDFKASQLCSDLNDVKGLVIE